MCHAGWSEFLNLFNFGEDNPIISIEKRNGDISKYESLSLNKAKVSTSYREGNQLTYQDYSPTQSSEH